MPNGKPGDHPLTDMLLHNDRGGFPADIFESVQQLSSLSGFDSISEQVSNLLLRHDPLWNNQKSDFEALRHAIEALRVSLED